MDEILQQYGGQLAGLTTAIMWTITPLFFTASSRRIGPVALNGVRLLFGVVLLGTTHRLLTGHWIPQAHSEQIIYLAVSGFIGLTIGDQVLFTSFLDIGPRLAMLIMTISPLVAAFFGWVVLGETLNPFAMIGIGMTLGGVAWVVAERPKSATLEKTDRKFRGVILAMIGAVCQAGGLLLSKKGMGHGTLPEDQFIPPQTATLIRMCFAALGMAPIVAVHAWNTRKRDGIDNAPRFISGTRAIGPGLLFALCGATTGPFLGVWMSLEAANRAPVGVAQTLCSLAPIFMLPTVAILHREHITLRATLGAILAVAGSALLFIEV